MPFGFVIKPFKDHELSVAIELAFYKSVMDAEREKLIVELKQALDEIKTLKGFLPICAACKKIRDDKGYWQQIEVYISDHSEAEFSHGMCPDCAREYYPEFFDKVKNKISTEN